MSISLTPQAAAHVQRVISKEGATAYLRVRVKPTGCSGYSYVVEATDVTQDEDHLFTSHGVNVVVDAQSLALIDGTEIDYGRDGLNAGFRFNNPNVKNTCGCGESFSV